jgi:hypothetical protein
MKKEQTEQQAPTKEEVIKFLSEQIEVKKVQVELQQLNTQLAVQRMEELKALSMIAQITNPQRQSSDVPEGAIPHTVTQEDLDNNPDLVEAGVQLGDEVLIPRPGTLEPEPIETIEEPVKKERTLRKV